MLDTSIHTVQHCTWTLLQHYLTPTAWAWTLLKHTCTLLRQCNWTEGTPTVLLLEHLPNYTANKGPVPIYVFPEIKLRGLLFPKKQKYSIMFCLPISTFMYLWAIYIFPGSVCLLCCRPILEYINHSQTREWRNWEWGCSVSLIGIHKSDFRYSVPYGS